MRYAHNRPKGFRLALALVGFILGVAHLSPIVIKDGFNLLESLRGFLRTICSDFRHDEREEVNVA